MYEVTYLYIFVVVYFLFSYIIVICVNIVYIYISFLLRASWKISLFAKCCNPRKIKTLLTYLPSPWCIHVSLVRIQPSVHKRVQKKKLCQRNADRIRTKTVCDLNL